MQETFNTALISIPQTLQPAVTRLWETLQEPLRELITADRSVETTLQTHVAHLPRLLCCSEFCGRLLQRDPTLLLAVHSSTDETAGQPTLLEQYQLADTGTQDEAAFMQDLRRFRQRQMFLITWNDLCLAVGLERTLIDLSRLADFCLQQALEFAQARIRQRFGAAVDHHGNPQQLTILALGKLGGKELNYSSDVDLILTYSETGKIADQSALSVHEYFTRVARKLVQYLDEVTADGFVFRVDLRLRPNGDSGPLVYSTAAMEHYYEGHGRDWERYALIKARVVAGDLSTGRALLATLKPFVYRRYLDFGAIESIRDMKKLIEQQLKRRGIEHNIKLGPGGIREIEFIAQSLQLVHGGRYPSLQTGTLQQAFAALVDTDLIAKKTALTLLEHYRLLRNTEHRLQMWRDQQTQLLPQHDSGRERLAYAMDASDWPAFQHRLQIATDAVQQLFSGIFRQHHAQDSQHLQSLTALWLEGLDDESAAQTLQHIGYPEPKKIFREFLALRHGSLYRHLSSRGRQRLDRLMPRLIEAAAMCTPPESTLLRLLQVITAIGRRSVYFALLLEQPMALQRLSEVCAASPWISNWIGQHPVVLDDLLRQAGSPEPETVANFTVMQQLLKAKLASAAADDTEAHMEILREFRYGQVLLEAVAAIAGDRSPQATGAQLAVIAEAILCQSIALARRSMTDKLLPKPCTDGRVPALAILAYGKLGGHELGYSSDLDIVFLFETCTEDIDPIQAQFRFSRLVQRIIHLLTLRTQGGQAYELDMRLRPSGNSGTLVTSFAAFAQYQQQRAWTWEHQALVRARLLGDDDALTKRFESIRQQVLCQRRDLPQLQTDVSHMREQMRRHNDRSTARSFDLKHGSGGIVDIEFMVQYLILAHAARWPQIIIPRSTIELLDALASTTAIDRTLASNLREIYRCYLGLEQRLKLHEKPPIIEGPEMNHSRQQIRQAWQQLFTTSSF